jgi:hypothetical protein
MEDNAFWLRLSSQIFLEKADFEKLGAAVLELCDELRC